ncbi:Multi antimicrobial extrusion protein (Na(+)/drug antiporter), MATE family of MDR efflux pump [Lunatimonas lonarensis]|uniref:Multidrug-efflux transporter n=1 Tax=Lunatimonas lonarensis TaxID=1232681 RepID=R7ZWF5_9BACT|nr:MATE family efflux transporter [Lunatimonas lonarensis]EON78334.1 Multi antimicrobial extrusion protein (Na(+)/drug antiporter), MATE family of MDR efflux pump [Lunatimonas lonarensis]
MAQRIRLFFTLFRDAIRGQEQDYTRISLKTGIFLLAVPMILEMLMESLFAVVDIFFVGKLGEHAMATVGLTEAMLTIVYSVGVGVSMAGTALVARRFGERDYHRAGTVSFQLLLVGLVSSAAMGIAGFIYAEELLILMGAEPELISSGAGFTRIIMAGNMAILLLFLINGIFRGAGQPHLAMRALWISNGLNIVLDPLFIFGWGDFDGWGLEGAAWATTLGRSVGVVYQLYHLLNGKHRLVIVRSNLKVRWKTLKHISKISIGGMGQFLVDGAAWIVLTRLAADFGSATVAGYTVAFRILIFSLMPAWGLSAAASTLVGQSLGAGKYFRAELSAYYTARYNLIFLGLVTGLYLVFADTIVGWFTDIPEVVHVASRGLKITVLGYVFFAVGMVMIQAFNGAGDTKTPAYINIVVFWLLEIPLAYIAARYAGWGPDGIFIVIAFCHSLHALVALWFFRKGYWKKTKV